jgi:hypothetical protein
LETTLNARRGLARIGLLALIAAALSGCCVYPYGAPRGHGYGHYQDNPRPPGR